MSSEETPTTATVAFGRRLRALRAEHDMSQHVLARRTDLHTTAISRFERGEREPRLKSILRLAEGLDVPPGALLNDLIA
jgi:transcriptional regulator with XRE-family HTH domain